MSARIDGQCDRRDHERHRRPCGSAGQGAGRSPWPKGGLAPLSAERGRNVAALAALQQHNHDDEKTDQDVDSGDDVDHKFNVSLSSTVNRPEARFARISGGKSMVRKGGFEPPRLSAPPPQDGVSASSTTSALI